MRALPEALTNSLKEALSGVTPQPPKPEDKPEDKPADKPEDKPEDKPAEKPGWKWDGGRGWFA